MAWYNVSGKVDADGSLAEYSTYRNHVSTGTITLVPDWSDSTATWMRFGLRRFGTSGQYSNSMEVLWANRDAPRVFTRGSSNTQSFPGGSLPPQLGGYERYALNARRRPLPSTVTGTLTWSGTMEI